VPAGTKEPFTVRNAMLGWLVVALLLIAMSIGRAAEIDETVVTVQITSADHELEEGYFSLGANGTLMVKPGSDLYRFLCRQRGRRVKIVLSEAGGPELSRLER
jgi:hypothetical protein